MLSRFTRAQSLALALLLVVGSLTLYAARALADTGEYRQVNLTSNDSGVARHTDSNLVNGWGLAYFPNNPFWVSDQVTGVSTLYDNTGASQGLVVVIPPAPEQPAGTIGSPTGMVANPTSHFVVSANGHSGPSFFLFSTLDGTISGWNPSVDVTHAFIGVDNFGFHSLYTGLAIAQTKDGPRLYAADAVNNRVDAFDGNFKLLFSFTDPHPPANLGAYGVNMISGRVIVTYASPVPNTGGVIDIFDVHGKFLGTFAKNGPGGPLEAPWAVVQSPQHFGQFSDALLIGNVDDGHISAFDPKTGKFLGQLTNANHARITIPGLWGLAFGAGGGVSGFPNELYFTAGPDGYSDGLFGKIIPINE